MHFFCAQGFAFRNNKVCTKCINGNYLNAIKYHCVGLKSIPSLFERYFIHKRALMANVFFSSNSSLDTLLQEYNVPQKNIFRFPIPFDFASSFALIALAFEAFESLVQVVLVDL